MTRLPRSAAAVSLLAVFAAGCVQTPALLPPPAVADFLASSPDAPAKDGLAAAYGVDEAWWRGYGDEQLNRLVDLTLERNLDFAQAAVAMKKALYSANRLGANLQPSLSAGVDGSIRKNIKDGGASSQSFGGEAAVSYEVDLWGRLRDLRTAQEWEYLATEKDRAALRLTLVNSAVDAYYHLVYLGDAIDATWESMARYEEIEAMTRTKYEAGKVDAIEPVQARQSYLAEKARLIDYQAQRKTVEQTLRNLLNLTPAEPLDFVLPSLAGFEPRAVDLEVPMSVLSNRPDLRALEYRLRRAFVDAGATRKNLYPAVTLGGALTSSGNRIGRVFDVPFAGGNVAVTFPFLQWNTIRWDIRLSEAEYEEVRLAFEQGVTEAMNEVDAYAFDYGKACETLVNSQEKYANDIQVGDYYQIRYETGANELSDWLDALNTISTSRLALAADRYRVVQSENLLYKALAGRYHPVQEPQSDATQTVLGLSDL